MWDRKTSDSSEQILAVRFEDVSEYGTKEVPHDTEQQSVRVKDTEIPYVVIRDREKVRKMLVKFEYI